MSNNPLSGIGYFFKGFALIFKPGIRQWVVIPLLINILLFSTFIYYAWLYFPSLFDGFVVQLQSWLPNWAWLVEMVGWLILPLFIVLVLITLFFIFAFVGNLIGEPFNGLLATAVEKHLTGKTVDSPAESWLKIIISFIWEKIGKLLYYLKWVIVLLIISFIPIVNLVSPVLWFLFGAWLAALEYADAPLENHGYNAPLQRQLLAKKRLLALGFGSAALVVMLIPVVNFFVMPVAVAGATDMWVHEFADSVKLEQSI